MGTSSDGDKKAIPGMWLAGSSGAMRWLFKSWPTQVDRSPVRVSVPHTLRRPRKERRANCFDQQKEKRCSMSDVDLYIMKFSPEVQERLMKIRHTALDVFERIDERIYFGIPTLVSPEQVGSIKIRDKKQPERKKRAMKTGDSKKCKKENEASFVGS